MMKGRLKKEKCDVGVLDEIVNDMHATVHAVVVWVSKEKLGGHFDGEVMDGCRLIRFVVFDECQRDVLQKLQGHAVALKNCNTQLSTYSKKNGNCHQKLHDN